MPRNLAVLDIDGTLTNTVEVDGRCYLRAASEVFGLQIDHLKTLDWSKAPHVTDAGILRWLCQDQFGREPLREELEGFVERLLGLFEAERCRSASCFGPIPGARAFVRGLSEVGWAVAIATGGYGKSARYKLRAAGIEWAEHCMACSDDAVTREEILALAARRARERHGAGFQKVVSVGDGVWDVRAAAAVGFGFVGVGRGRRAEKLREAGAAVVVEDFSDLPTVLGALESAAREPSRER
jgi:phosphoglycolate phosphatase-like HAD superfamily hydrolase